MRRLIDVIFLLTLSLVIIMFLFLEIFPKTYLHDLIDAIYENIITNSLMYSIIYNIQLLFVLLRVIYPKEISLLNLMKCQSILLMPAVFGQFGLFVSFIKPMFVKSTTEFHNTLSKLPDANFRDSIMIFSMFFTFAIILFNIVLYIIYGRTKKLDLLPKIFAWWYGSFIYGVLPASAIFFIWCFLYYFFQVYDSISFSAILIAYISIFSLSFLSLRKRYYQSMKIVDDR